MRKILFRGCDGTGKWHEGSLIVISVKKPVQKDVAPYKEYYIKGRHFGRVFFEERIPLVRKQHREKEMQKILLDLIETLSGKPFKFWDNPAVRPAAEGIITFAENYKQ